FSEIFIIIYHIVSIHISGFVVYLVFHILIYIDSVFFGIIYPRFPDKIINRSILNYFASDKKLTR
ncbi:MAG: hypothetical protein ABIN24_15075, partial [Dyadobacter sp.]